MLCMSKMTDYAGIQNTFAHSIVNVIVCTKVSATKSGFEFKPNLTYEDA